MERTSLGRNKAFGKDCCPSWHSMEAGGAIAKMFPWTQIQLQSETFLLINTQQPKIPLAGKTGMFLMDFLVGLSLLVHINIPYNNDHSRRPPPDLPEKLVPSKFDAIIPTLIFWVCLARAEQNAQWPSPCPKSQGLALSDHSVNFVS